MTDPKQFDWSFVGLDFGNWEEDKIWALDLPVSKINIKDLEWHLDCPFWEHDNGERYTEIKALNGLTSNIISTAWANASPKRCFKPSTAAASISRVSCASRMA